MDVPRANYPTMLRGLAPGDEEPGDGQVYNGAGRARSQPRNLRPAVLAEYWSGLGVNTVAGDARPTQRCGRSG